MSMAVPSLRGYSAYFLKLGTIGFGGPIALASAMHRDLVDERGWVTDEEYREGLALAQLAPGPLAAQLAIFLGWLRFGVTGATAVGIAFILPSFLMVLVLATAYVRFGGLPWIQGAFHGIGAAVVAIIARGAWKLVNRTLGQDRVLWGLFFVSALVTAWTETELIWLIVACGVAAMVAKERPKVRAAASAMVPLWLITGLAGPAPASTLFQILWYFTIAGSFVFGSGLAIVPFLHTGVVSRFHWLTERQFLDAVAVAMITPGPVVITTAFIGFLVAGPVGATLAAVGVFLPAYLVVVISASHFRRIARNRRIKSFVNGVTAGAVGAIAGAAVILGRRAVHDLPSAAIAVIGLVLLASVKWITEPLLIGAAALTGILFLS
jgi:chromate transporter